MKINWGPVIYTYHIGMNAHHLSHSGLGLCVGWFFTFNQMHEGKPVGAKALPALWKLRLHPLCRVFEYCTVL